MEDNLLYISERQLKELKTAAHDLEILRRMYDRVVAERDAMRELSSLAVRAERLAGVLVTLKAVATDEQ